MSKIGEMKELIINIMSDGKTHTAQEILEVAKVQNLINKEVRNPGIMRSAIHSLKNENENFVNVGRGMYKLNTINTNFEKLISTINERIDYLHSLQWYNCSEIELEVARKEVVLLRALADKIRQELLDCDSDEATSENSVIENQKENSDEYMGEAIICEVENMVETV